MEYKLNPKITITKKLSDSIQTDVLLKRLYPEFKKKCDEGKINEWLDDHPEFFDRMMSYANHPDIKVEE